MYSILNTFNIKHTPINKNVANESDKTVSRITMDSLFFLLRLILIYLLNVSFIFLKLICSTANKNKDVNSDIPVKTVILSLSLTFIFLYTYNIFKMHAKNKTIK